MRLSGLSIMIMLVGVIVIMGIHNAESETMPNANLTTSNNVTANTIPNANLTTSDNVTANKISNTTASSMTSEVEIKKQVSDFLAGAIPLFQQQRTETLQQIKNCIEQKQKASPANMAQINDQCKTKLSDIKAKYKEQRAELQTLIKNHRSITIPILSSQIGKIHSEASSASMMKPKTTEKPKTIPKPKAT